MRQDSAKVDAAPATDPLVSAVETVNRARRQLESLLEQIREDYRSVYAAFRDLERQFRESGASPDTANADGIDPRTPDDQLESLRDSYAARSEEIVRLANAARRVETVLRQLDSSARYLLNPPDVLAIADATSTSSQLRALELQEDERQRLAREIHDGPAQVLANAIFQMEFCLRLVEKDPARLPAELAHLKSDLREGLAETRYFIFDLRSDQLAEIGLVAMLRRYVDSFQTRFGIDVQLDASDDLPRLPDKKELAAFRVIQESLQNTRKHSGATKATVSLRADDGALVIVASDNGRGFVTDSVAGSANRHFGLSSMRERAKLINASFQINSALGQGTSVTLRVPLDT